MIFRPAVGALHLLPVLPGGNLHNFDKIAVKAGDGAEAHRLGDIQHGILGAAQQIAGLCDSGVVYKVQRRGAHDIVENPAEMGGAPMAEVGQVFNGKLTAVIFFYVIQSRSDNQGVVAFRLVFYNPGALRAPPHSAPVSAPARFRYIRTKADPLR